MISKSRRDSVGGGSRRDSVGGVVAEIFRYIQLRNHIFTTHRVIFLVRYVKNKDFLLKKITEIAQIP